MSHIKCVSNYFKGKSLCGVACLVVAVAAGIFGSENTWAHCTANNGQPTVSPMNLPIDAPVGHVIGSFSYTVGYVCTPAGAPVGATAWDFRATSLAGDEGGSGIADVRRTTEPGIGIRWKETDTITGITLTHTSTSLDYPTTGFRRVALNSVSSVEGVIEYVKIGPVTGDVVPRLTLAHQQKPSNGSFSHILSIDPGEAPITKLSCDVMTKNLTIPLGEIVRTQFLGLGTVAGGQTTNLQLNCVENTPVTITVDATAHSSMRQGVIALTNPDAPTTAQNVGLQVSINGNRALLSQPVSVGKAPSGLLSIVVGANYQQTSADRVTAGEANGTATFTMTYN